MQVKHATIRDVKGIHGLINHYAQKGMLLPRSLNDLYDHLRNYFVLKTDEHSDTVYGVCALGICWEDLAEIKSLAVAEDKLHRGLGTLLVRTCLDDARAIGLKKVFALTYVPDFFRPMGFAEIEKTVLPHKIWADCLNCPKFPDCDETAMMITLPDD